MNFRHSPQRSRFLLQCVEANYTYKRVVAGLASEHMDPVSSPEWSLWVNYYHPLTSDNPIYKNELIYNNRTLSWFARKLCERHDTPSLS